MAEYRMVTENGDVVDTHTFETDHEAVAWRSSRPFEAATGADDSRQLRLERQDGGEWVRIPAPLGTAETT